jgi:hypothetical protein
MKEVAESLWAVVLVWETDMSSSRRLIDRDVREEDTIALIFHLYYPWKDMDPPMSFLCEAGR